MTDTTPLLLLEEARAIARRAVDKAEDLGQRGAFVVVDDGGIVITASRMDGTGSLSYPVSRAKAYGAAVHREPSAAFAERFSHAFAGIFSAFQQIVRDAVFPGAGAQPILKEGRLVGAISTGLGVPPFVKFPGLEPMKLIVEGKPANAEDLCISYALRKPYSPQHGDDLKRWIDAYGKPPEGQGIGLAEAPRSTKQLDLDAAIRMCDTAMAEAKRRNAFVSIVIVDQHADVVQLDRMDNAAPMTPDAAEALAATAVNFRAPSSSAAKYPDLRALSRVTPFKYLPVPGGLPLVQSGRVTGAIGVSGADPEVCETIARVATGTRETPT
jgi:glc operon protein GlcG